MAKILTVTFTASKTMQEKQYEPVRLEVSYTAEVAEGEEPEKVLADLEFRAYQELFRAQENYFRMRDTKRTDLESRQRELQLTGRQLAHY